MRQCSTILQSISRASTGEAYANKLWRCAILGKYANGHLAKMLKSF